VRILGRESDSIPFLFNKVFVVNMEKGVQEAKNKNGTPIKIPRKRSTER